MNSTDWIRLLIGFIGIVLIQVFLVSNITYGAYLHPMVYPWLILVIPFGISRWMLLFIAFALGLSVDAFLNTAGLNAGALVFMAYMRQPVINMQNAGSGMEEDKPRIRVMGISWFFLYSVILLFLHHLAYFSLEVFNPAHVKYILFSTVLSLVVSFILIFVLEMIFSPRKSQR